MFAEPNYLGHYTQVPPNDTRYAELWGLNQASDADIDAPEAWATTTGSNTVIVGVADSGVTWDHPDLAGNIWVTTTTSVTASTTISMGSSTTSAAGTSPRTRTTRATLLATGRTWRGRSARSATTPSG